MNIDHEEIASRLAEVLDHQAASDPNVGTVGHKDRRRVLVLVGEGGPSEATRLNLIKTLGERGCVVTSLAVADADPSKLSSDAEYGLVLLLGDAGEFSKNIGLPEQLGEIIHAKKMRPPTPAVENFCYRSSRIGKGQRKANRHDRWKGFQGASRHY